MLTRTLLEVQRLAPQLAAFAGGGTTAPFAAPR